jgi:hypothetical protein
MRNWNAILSSDMSGKKIFLLEIADMIKNVLLNYLGLFFRQKIDPRGKRNH